ncbi:hypothetical protein RRG48_04895 [Mycoplasmopsis canis]|uniref:hypothetical protein n=1 Tax=Mycoplasmopsis cynos TaxID=171284 RepID=UPI002AFFC4A5|nr:hypothetical protein [Mycoplasmopsis cynos]WQQ13442.1 hypothetical protein RRG58_01705 [Mycoplasmopsis cynos]WQQ13717.1 hypothetical protein RRG52_03115 [Mycoplasmopsis cynos]
MKTKLDLTNYNNFYKTESEKEELKKELYKLANNKKRPYYYDLDDEAFDEFFKVKGDIVYLRDDLTIEELIFYINSTYAYYSFWTFAKWDIKRKKFCKRPEFHTFSTKQHKEFVAELKLAQNYLAETE